MFRRIILFSFAALAAVYLFWTASLIALRTVNPPTTGVQIQRRIEAWVHGTRYRKRYTFVPLSKISPEMQHAVISAEDGTFYRHHGIDWDETEKVAQESQDKGKLARGASTITQQLVKNLFFTTHRNPVRKAFEYASHVRAPKRRPLAGKVGHEQRSDGGRCERAGAFCSGRE